MKNAITLHRAMGAQVLNHLRQFGDLPSQGILAGQAVDSTITDLFGQGGGVYNDLDIFRNVPNGARRGIRDFATRTATRATLALQTPSDYAGMQLTLSLVQSYSIKSVSRQGMLNFVNCTMDEHEATRRLTANHVLSGFDLNCTRVGVDLSTGELHWDRHYEEFLRSRQLRIAMMHTPWHTFLRLAKKSEELPNVFVDIAAAAEACVGVANSTALVGLKSSHNVSMLFGERQKAQAEATRSIWTPYFELESKVLHQTSEGAYWRDLSDNPPDEGKYKSVTLYGLAPRGELNPTLQKRCDGLGESVVFFAQKVIDEARRAKPANAYAKLDALAKRRQAAVANPDGDYVLMCARMFGTDYVQGQALPEVGDKLASWIAKHSGFARPLLGLSLGQQHQVMQDVTNVSREFGDLHYDGDTQAGLGVLELQASIADLFSKERMLDILTKDFAINGVPFEVTPLPLPETLPDRFKNFVVKELLTGNALRREGKDMHHCVGGYSSHIRSNQSRIVSIKHKDEVNSHNCSTIEFRGQFHKDRFADMNIRMNQNRTLSNKEPSPRNRELAEYLSNYLPVAELIAEGDVCKMAAEARQTLEANTQAIDATVGRMNELEVEMKALKAELRELESTAKVKASLDTILQELACDARMAAHRAAVADMDEETRAIYEAIHISESVPHHTDLLDPAAAPMPVQALEAPPGFPVFAKTPAEEVAPEPSFLQRLRNALGFQALARQRPPIAT